MRKFILLVAMLLLPVVATAQTTFFASDDPRGTLTNTNAARNAFISALTLGSGTETSETLGSFAPSPTLSFGATGVTATTNFAFVADFTGNPFNLAISGVKALLDETTAPDVFTFSSLVNGFGFYLTQMGDDTNVNTISITLSNTNNGYTKTFNLGTFQQRGFDSVIYFGVIDVNQFNQVTYNETFDGDGTLFDDVTVGFTSVPEPGTIALMGLAGLVSLGGYGYRRYRLAKAIAA